MRTPRTLVLDPPIEVETLWRRMASALPPLVRFFVPHDHADLAVVAELATAPLAEVRGPHGGPDRLSYVCAERGAFANLDLSTRVHAGSTHREVTLAIVQRTVSNGLSVLDLWVASQAPEGVTGLAVACRDDRLEPVFALLRPACG